MLNNDFWYLVVNQIIYNKTIMARLSGSDDRGISSGVAALGPLRNGTPV